MPAVVPFYRGSSSVGVGRSAAGTLSPPMPTRPAIANVGDLIGMYCWADNGTVSITTANGGAWTAVTGSPFGSTEKLYIWWRIHQSGDGAPTLTAAGQAAAASILAVTGIIATKDTFNSGTPIDAVGTAGTGTSQTASNTGVTTATNAAMVLHLVGVGNDVGIGTWTFGGSATDVYEEQEVSTTQGNDAEMAIAQKPMYTAGASGSASAAIAGGVNEPWVSICFAIKPASSDPVISEAGYSNNPGAHSQTSVITLKRRVELGDSSVVTAMGGVSALASVVDSKGNSYTINVQQTDGAKYASIARARVTTQLEPGDTITLTWGSVNDRVIGGVAYAVRSNLAAPLTNGNTATSASWSSGSVSLASGKTYAMFTVEANAAVAADNLVDSAWTGDLAGVNGLGETNGVSGHKNGTGAATESGSGTLSASSVYAAAVAAYELIGDPQTLTVPLLDTTPDLYAPTVTQIEDNDPGTVDDPITGTVYINGETVRSVEEVQLYVTHPNTSHLLVTIKPPDNSPEVTLFDHRGSGADIGASSGSPLILRDDAATTLASSFTSGTGMTRKPESPLSAFHNEAGGIWTITVTDTSTSTQITLPYARIDSKGPQGQKKVLKLKLYTFDPTLYPPTVTATASTQTLVVPLLDSSPTLYAPTVTPSTWFLVLPLLTVSPDLYAPSVVPGTVHLVLPLLDTAPDLYPPYLDPRAVQLVVPLLTVDPDLYAPVVTAGIIHLVLPLLTITPDLYAPAVNPREVTLVLPLLDSAPTLFAPVVLSYPTQTLVVPLLDVVPALYAPTLRLRLDVDLLIVEPVLYPPTVIPGPVELVLPLIDTPYDLFPPILLRRVWRSRPGHQEVHNIAGAPTENRPGHKEKINPGETIEVIG